MSQWPTRSLTIAAVLVGGTLIGGVLAMQTTGWAQTQTETYRAPRSPHGDGRPDLSGIWQALNTANWDLEDHGMSPGALWQLGAIGGVPPGKSVVDGGEIPYQPWAAAKKQENFKNRLVADVYRPDIGDPELKCHMPGIPRATYLPYPFQIVQTPTHIMMAYTYAGANRVINMTNHREAPVDSWMGWSNGTWDGDTLVVTVTGLNGYSWFDRAGNFATSDARIVERYRRTGPDHLAYEVTIEDAKVFTRPWTIRMPLYRVVDEDAQLLEYRCVELSEEVLYGHLSKTTNR